MKTGIWEVVGGANRVILPEFQFSICWKLKVCFRHCVKLVYKMNYQLRQGSCFHCVHKIGFGTGGMRAVLSMWIYGSSSFTVSPREIIRRYKDGVTPVPSHMPSYSSNKILQAPLVLCQRCVSFQASVSKLCQERPLSPCVIWLPSFANQRLL